MRCPTCQVARRVDAPPGFCPVCELSGALAVPVGPGPGQGDEALAETLHLRIPKFDAAASPREANAAAPTEQGAPLSLSDLKKIRYFGDYELLEEVARGGMGTVFKARQTTLNRIVALKLISAGVLASPDAVKRFNTEAAAAARLDHPNIVPIYEIGEHECQPYFSMAFIDGPTLGQALGGRPMPARRAAQLLITVARAVQFAHQHGVLHRDLKPGNILLDAQGEPHLTDFGLARVIQQDSVLTHTNVVMGTPAYMSPEQARGDAQGVTTAVDVYGLGAVLYEALTGTPPFGGGTSLATIRQVLEQEPRRPSIFNAEVDRDLETICLKCLEKEPGRRYGSAEAFLEELERWLRREPILARPSSPWEKIGKWVRRKPALAAASGTALLLLLIVAIGSPIAVVRIRRAQERSEQNLYVAGVRLASQALEEHDLVGARLRLQGMLNSPKQRAMRGWEWRYLMSQCHGDELATIGRHEAGIAAVVFSPDDQTVIAIGEDGVVKLWDVMTGKEAGSWQAHTNLLHHRRDMTGHSLALSPDGLTLATGGADGQIHLWDLASRQRVAQMGSLSGWVNGLAFSRDGRMLAGGCSEEVGLWSLTNRPPRQTAHWPAKIPLAFGVAFSADDKHLIVGGFLDSLHCWDISNPEIPLKFPCFKGSSAPAVVSPDGKWLAASAPDDPSVRLWNLETGQPSPALGARGVDYICFTFSPDSRVLAAGLRSGEIILWDTAGQREPVTLVGHEELVHSLAFTHNGTRLVSASADNTLRLWDASMKPHREPVMQHGTAALGVRFSPNSRYLASSASESGKADGTHKLNPRTLKLWERKGKVWDEAAEAVVVAKSTGDYESDISFSPSGKIVGVSSYSSLRFQAVPDLQLITNIASGNLPAFSDDGRTLLHTVIEDEPERYRLVRRDSPTAPEIVIGEQPGHPTALAVSPDGSLAASSTELSDGAIDLWQVRQRRQLTPLKGHALRVVFLTFSPDGKTLASASWDGKLGLWEVASQRNLGLLRGHNGEVSCAAFSPDGRTIVTSGRDATLRFWNVETRQEMFVLRGRKLNVNSVAFSPDADGQWLAAACQDGAIRLWRAPALGEFQAEGRPSPPK